MPLPASVALASSASRRARRGWHPREKVLAGVFALLLLLALAAPALPTPALATGAFADTRHWHGLANAMDVLSNAPFALAGAWGLWLLRGLGNTAPSHTLGCARLFFAGLLVTAAGSAFFHLAPDTLRLAADRAGMAVAFAGLIGLAVCERVSQRAGWAAAWATLAGGLLAAAVHARTDNVLPWALVQFGGMGLVLWLAALRPVPGSVGLGLWAVIGCYALAKVFELADHAVFDLMGQLVAGHTLKHVVAAGAAGPVLRMAGRLRRDALLHNPGAAGAA